MQHQRNLKIKVQIFFNTIPGGHVIWKALTRVNRFYHLSVRGRIYSSYPFVLVLNPLHLLITLWNSRVLANRKNWSDFPNFSLLSVFTAPYYWARALEIQRFGRKGVSSSLGLGDQKLSQYWFYTLPSLYAYWKAGAVTLLISMFVWWASHFLWLYDSSANIPWFVAVLILLLFSTTFFQHTFVCQNYNVVGWMFMPAGLYGCLTENWVIASLAWFCASIGSFTVVFLACLLSVVYAFHTQSFLPIMSVLPAVVKLLLHLLPCITDGTLFATIGRRAKTIGMMGRAKVRYKRDDVSLHYDLSFRIKTLLLHSQFVVIYYFVTGYLPILVIAAIGIWLMNSTISRFADDQSMEMLIFTVTISHMLLVTDFSLLLLLSWWLIISPFYARTSVLAPVNVRLLLEKMMDFLKPVDKGKRILMAFDDPQGKLDNLFDSQRFLIDFPIYIASMKKVHLMPDFSSVYEVNYEGAPDFWGRNVDDVKRQMVYWKADYVLIYQRGEIELDNKWAASEFKELSHFSWRQFEYSLGGKIPVLSKSSLPDWWLLERKSKEV